MLGPADFEAQRDALGREYHLEFVPGWAEELKERFRLKLLGEP
ncbi:MAG TPA: hypothetical protein VGQ83_04135 [Polyangia bacterium]|jgi:hypothetical protein